MAFVGTAAIAVEQEPLSDPSQWGDIARPLQPTADCVIGTVEQLERAMAVVDAGRFENADLGVPDSLRNALRANDRALAVWYQAPLPDGSFWGFEGFVVAREECVLHAAITGFDN